MSEPKMATTPEEIARWLLKRLALKSAINYTLRCLEGPTLRGERFWKDVLHILALEAEAEASVSVPASGRS